jgi:hypothetical protein
MARVDVSGAHVIFARAPTVKGSTVRNKLDLPAVVAVCWNCDVTLGPRLSVRALVGGQCVVFFPAGVRLNGQAVIWRKGRELTALLLCSR